MFSIFIGIGIVLLGIGLDQLVKFLIEQNMYLGEKITIIDGFFSISFVKNDGAAFSLFAGNKIFLIIVTIAALAIFAFLCKECNFKKRKLYSIGLTLMISGTIGNFIDRIFKGKVTDMFDFIILGFDFAVFNIADVLLCVGIFIFALDLIFYQKGEEANEEYLDNND